MSLQQKAWSVNKYFRFELGTIDMMTSSNGNIFRVTGPLCGNLLLTGEFPAQRPVTRSFDVFFDLRLIQQLVNNGDVGDLRRHRAHYYVILMIRQAFSYVIRAEYVYEHNVKFWLVNSM